MHLRQRDRGGPGGSSGDPLRVPRSKIARWSRPLAGWPGKAPGDVGEEKFFELKVGGKPIGRWRSTGAVG